MSELGLLSRRKRGLTCVIISDERQAFISDAQ